jgi:hypothetical protein
MLRSLMNKTIQIRDDMKLPRATKTEIRLDQNGLPELDPGIERAMDEGIAWLGRAQDCSASADGGVARDYSLISGWASSYPETTGYIVPTMIDYAKLKNDKETLQRAKRMLDWLVSIQLPGGGYQGGKVDATPVLPVTFNTGQILLGLASGVSAFGEEYRKAMRAAADWLIKTQDSDGCWRRNPTPFAALGEKAYETHVAWGLFEAARLDPDRDYAEAGLANIRWALGLQHDNGWFEHCCLDNPVRPLTHTIGYVLRGLVEGYRLSQDSVILDACRKTADGILTAVGTEGYLAGRLDANWKPAVHWVCLTGSAQIAHSLLFLYQETGNVSYRDAGFALNRYVRRTMKIHGPSETRGGIKGSFPVDGNYGKFEYLSWASKFLIDSLMLEQVVRADLN